jgi:acyl transferase domain-containing protein
VASPYWAVKVQVSCRFDWQADRVVKGNCGLKDSDIAIVGVAGRFPGAVTLSDFDALLSRGAVAHREVPRERWDHRLVHSHDCSSPNRTPARMGGFIDNFTRFAPEYFGLSLRRARIMDPQQRLVLEVTRQALDDAGYR